MLTYTNELVNLVMDGNSLIFGNATSVANRIGEKLMALAPINGGMTYKNLALGGATFQMMLNGSDGSGVAAVHAAFEPGKQNLLFIMEGVNSANYGRDTAGIIADCKAYIDAVKVVHPEWRIYIITALAFQNNNAGDEERNAQIDGYNAYLRTNYTELGAEGFVETRPPGGPLAFTSPYNYSETNFTKSGLYQDATHPNAAGNSILAQYIADKLKTIPDVAPGPLQKIARFCAGFLRLRNGAPAITKG